MRRSAGKSSYQIEDDRAGRQLSEVSPADGTGTSPVMTSSLAHEEETEMADLEAKSFSSPEETRQFAGKGKMDIVNVGGMTVGKGVFEAGWRWSTNVKPLAGTDSCQAAHLGFIMSGRMRVRMDDGTEAEAGPGEAVHIAPGHDAWVVGDEDCVFIDFGASVGQYAKPS